MIPYSGQDVLANLIYGDRTSLMTGVLSTVLVMVLGLRDAPDLKSSR